MSALLKGSLTASLMESGQAENGTAAFDAERVRRDLPILMEQVYGKHLGVAASARASMACYNTRQDIDALGAGLAKVQEVFR